MNSKLKHFPNQTLNCIIQGTKALPDSIANILDQIAALNIQQTFSSISTIHSILTHNHQSSSIFVRSLQVLKYVIQTCSYAAIMLTEVYVLPVLSQKLGSKRQSGLFSQKSSSLSRVSHQRQSKYCSSFKGPIIQLIFLAAHIKPYRMAANSQINQKSDFQIAKQQLSEHQGSKMIEFTLQKWQKLRDKFINQIKELNFTSLKYSQDLLKKWRQSKEPLNTAYSLQIEKLLFQGDYYLISSFLQQFYSFIQIQGQLQDSLQHQFAQLFLNLLRKGFIQVIVFLLDNDFSFLLSKRVEFLHQLNQGKRSILLNIYQQIQMFRQTFLTVFNTDKIQIAQISNSIIKNSQKDSLAFETIQMITKNSLRNNKIVSYLNDNCHKSKIIIKSKQLNSKMLVNEANNEQNIQTVRIDDYQVEELSEYDVLKSKMQKKRGNIALESSKMGSTLRNLRQNLSSQHSKDSKFSMSKRSLGKTAGIKLYSQLKKQRKEESYFDISLSQQTKGLQKVQREDNSSPVYSIANVSLRDNSDSKLLKDNQEGPLNQENSQADLIESPDLLPQRNSYYLENDQNSVLNNNNVMSFKAALNENFEGIDARQKELCLIQQQSILKNMVKSPKVGSKFNKHSEYLPTSSSKVSKFNRQDVVVQTKNEDSCHLKTEYRVSIKQSQSELALLEQKVKKLQKQKLLMRTQLAIKSNQLGNLKCSSVYGSEKNIVFHQTPNDSQIFPCRQSRQKVLKGLKLRRQEDSEFEKEIQVKYQPFLQKFRGNTGRKNLLRSKILIQNSEELQFGLLSQLCQNQLSNQSQLELTFFITFQKFDALDFVFSFVQNPAFAFKSQTTKPLAFKLKKQRKVSAKLKVLSMPFHLPQIQISYKSNSQYNFKKLKITLPLSFNKFVKVNQYQIRQDLQSGGECLRTNVFPLNSKNMPIEKTIQYLTGWSTLQQERKGQFTSLGAACTFQKTQFHVILKLSEKGCIIEGYLLGGEAQVVEFYVCTLKKIFELQRK